MTRSNAHYAPWERTDWDDAEVTEPLDEATPEQIRGFVRELMSIAETREAWATTTSEE